MLKKETTLSSYICPEDQLNLTKRKNKRKAPFEESKTILPFLMQLLPKVTLALQRSSILLSVLNLGEMGSSS